MLEAADLEAVDALWQQTVNQQKWSKELIQTVKSHDQTAQLLKAHFTRTNPTGDNWVLYNWFIGTAFGIGINHLKKL